MAAEREHDPAAGCPLFQFVYLRAHAGMLAYYRKEWAYATHSGAPSISVEDNSPGELTSPASAPDQIAAVGELREALQALPGEDRHLLLSLFVDGRTESELAETLKVSQHTVSKRKRTAVTNLRKLLFDSNQSRQMAQPTGRITHTFR